MKTIYFGVLWSFAFLVLSACGGGSGSDSGGQSPDDGANQEVSYEEQVQSIRSALDAYNSDTDFTLYVKSASGNSLIHSTGSSTETTSYESASTSKMVAAAVILNQVKSGRLSLTDHPQDYINGWPDTGNLSLITLAQLLTFTSGLVNEPLCIHLGWSDFEDCIQTIADDNSAAITPGSEFYYASTHLQVAGLMAVKAAGVDNWTTLFNQFKQETGLFTEALFDLPSLTNPRLAGGMHWKATEFVAFLEALYKGEILTQELIGLMTSDQFNGAVITYSPALSGLGFDWRYGYGIWIECDQVPYNCETAYRVSSVGAYGAYPVIDFTRGYYGILARQGALGSFTNGYWTFDHVSESLEEWATY